MTPVTRARPVDERRKDVDDGASEAAPPVILVDADDRAVGLCGKMEAHERGLLHRAVSVFAFDADGALLLQQRAAGKYHSGGRWSNSACSHPRPEEGNEQAARRCLQEEMGVACDWIAPAFRFTYRAQVSPALIEHELDHVFVARVSETPAPSSDEVADWRRVRLEDVSRECAADPTRFSAWFPIALEQLMALEIVSRATAASRGDRADGANG